MTCDIFYPTESSNNHAFSLMRQSAKKFGIDLRLKFFGDALDFKVDAAIIRGYDFSLSKELEEGGVRVFNSTQAMQNVLNKAKSYEILGKYHMPQPLSYLINRDVTYHMAIEMIGSNIFVLKSLAGSKGDGVWLIGRESDYTAVLQNFDDNQFLLQEYIEESAGRDIRVWVAGGRASAAVMRVNDSSFLSNISVGGSAHRVELMSELSDIGIKSSMALGLDFSGVDILIGRDGYKVCEVNGNAGFRSAIKFGYYSVVDDIFDHIKSVTI